MWELAASVGVLFFKMAQVFLLCTLFCKSVYYTIAILNY